MTTETNTAALPTGKIGDLEISRMMLGGNLLSHYHHCRDQHYVFKLVEHYNTPEKVLETLAIAEEHGINGMNIHTVDWVHQLMKQHRDRGGKMQWILCATASTEGDDLPAYREEIMRLAELGADAFYVWGCHSDGLVADGKIDVIGKCLDIFRECGLPAGVGAHDLEVIKASEANGLNPDFYVKTFHHHDYPSGPQVPPDQLEHATDEHIGYWDRDPAGTAKFMETVDQPWIAFKTMAAGTIPPESALKYIFENGADFVFFGMFDYEIAGDVELASTILTEQLAKDRARPWCG
ncbi:hypothetical protein LCGC14_0018760 [marine sediment metagenome]|uniref:HpcH/HpaI aldolase/citrate lyase domain-containing protein n=1 Tax=marine sediment metagenome TaxID=412755 RepID=A0A0F9W4Z2_9ZZZZ|nr:hypothetical protein [Phycisphaerae bacterium]HDZ44912.1 hypothetical protein [Phycisphaerae bacterium]